MIPFRENNCRANSKSQETIENDALSQEMVTQLKLEDTENINTLSMASNNTSQFHNINSHRSIVPLSYGDNPSFPAASKAIDLRDDCLKFSSSFQKQVVNADDNQVYGNYHNGPEYSFAVENNLHYDADVPGWEGAMVTDKNQHYE